MADVLMHTIRQREGYNACTCRHCKASTAFSSRKRANIRRARHKMKQSMKKEVARESG